MAINRVDFGGNTLIDLTGDTLESAEQLLKGIIAHAKDGSVITGQMEAGGGSGGRAFASGSFTLSSDLSGGYTITHDLGEIPYFFLVFCKSTNSLFTSPSYAVFALFGFSQSIGANNNFGIQGSSLGAFSDLITGTNSKRPLYDATSTTISTRSSSYTLVGGNEYHWIAIGA